MLQFVREKNRDPHHIFGSYGDLKSTDLMLLGLTRSEHDEAEKDKSTIAIANLAESINLLQEFTIDILKQLKELKCKI